MPPKTRNLDYARSKAGGVRRAWAGAVVLAAVVGAAGAATAVLLPSLNRTRCGGDRNTCARQLRGIGQAVQMYANENRGRFPRDFETILLTQDLTSYCFVCPTSAETPATGPTPQAIADQLSAGGHLSYVYAGRGMTIKTPAEAVLAYEPLANHGTGGHVLFADGTVRWLSAAELTKLIAALNAGHNPPRLPAD